MKWYRFIFLVLILSLSIDVSGADETAVSRQDILIGIIPFANYTGTNDAKNVMIPIIESSIIKQHANTITSAEIRNTLRSYRIRAAGSIGSEDAQILKENLGVTHLLLGSLNFYDTTNIEAGLSARIVSVDNLEIIWCSSNSATGSDFEILLGLGKVDKIGTLVQKIADECFSKLSEKLSNNESEKKNNKASVKWAIIPFDNYSPNRNAGPVVDNILLTELHRRGIEILEPGIVLDIFRKNNRLPRGQVDLEVINDLHEKNDVDLILTGAIEKFRQRSSRSRGSTPIFEYDARIINARTGMVLTTGAVAGKGKDYESIFKMGAINSLGDLIKKMSWSLINKLNKQIKKRYHAKR